MVLVQYLSDILLVVVVTAVMVGEGVSLADLACAHCTKTLNEPPMPTTFVGCKLDRSIETMPTTSPRNKRYQESSTFGDSLRRALRLGLLRNDVRFHSH